MATLGLLNFFESKPIGLFEMSASLLIALLACLRPGKVRVILQLIAILFAVLVSICVFFLWGQGKQAEGDAATSEQPTFSIVQSANSEEADIIEVDEGLEKNVGILNAQGVSLLLLIFLVIADNFCICKADYERT